MNDPKARSRKKTSMKSSRPLRRCRQAKARCPSLLWPRLAGVTPALIHNTYPISPRRSEGWWARQHEPSAMPSMTRWFVNARSTGLYGRNSLRRVRTWRSLRRSIKCLLNEVALLKGMATGKVVSILQPKRRRQFSPVQRLWSCSLWLMAIIFTSVVSGCSDPA
jgi:hypothetical protein